MNASRARRRWMKWCRYVQKTGTMASYRYLWQPGSIHAGQVGAYSDYTFAKRYPPIGARHVHLPRWGVK